MKNLNLFLILFGFLAAQSVFAQSGAHLKLSSQYPGAGETIRLTYDPSGTALDGYAIVTGVVYYLDNKDYPAADISFKLDGKLLKGEISVPLTAKAFFIKLSADEKVDNNNDKGYVFAVYKDKQPVPGAYASEGYMYSSGMGQSLAKIKTDATEGLALFEKEYTLYPQSEKDYLFNYYALLLKSPEYKAKLSQKIDALAKSADEKDLMTAANLLRQTKNTKAADSLTEVIKAKFPDGALIKNMAGTAFAREKDLAKKDSLYQAYIKKYPENTTEKSTIQDNFRVQLASAYLQKGDLTNYYKYEGQIKNKLQLAGTLNNVTYEWAKKGERLTEAEKLSKQSLDILTERANSAGAQAFSTPSQAKSNIQATFDTYADTYAYILFKENKFTEALKYEQDLIDHDKGIDAEVYEHYVLILQGTGNHAKAKEAAEKAVKLGKGSSSIKEVLKQEYVKAKGTENGYDQYLASLENVSQNKLRTELAKTMINQPAPLFALKDLDGKLVSLKDLKGKVVIVDFWATWCGPCKASFPGMQLAVNKYKNDPNVKFLFVDTWENGDNYLPEVKKFIADNKYTFHVIMDEKVASGKQEKVISTYGVDGIPTKFVIDKNGNIRFKYVGYSGTPDSLVDEVTAMIDMASNPDSVVSSQVK